MHVRQFLFRHQVRLILALLAASLVVAEAALRWRPLPGYVTDLIYVQAADPEVHRPNDDTRILYELKPSARLLTPIAGGGRRRVTINSLGLRDPERSIRKPAGVFRIVVLGSSTTFGATVSDGEIYPAYLEQMLNETATAERRYEVWNAGVSAYTPQQMVGLARRLLEQGVDPDVVLFQVSLVGRRGFLMDHVDPDAFVRDADLLREHFLLPWNWLAGPARHSRLALLAVAHYNRRQDQNDRREKLWRVATPHHQRALREFVAEHRGRFHLAALSLPCDAAASLSDAELVAWPAGIPTWCVRVDDAAPEFGLMHPPAAVYRAWARQLAGNLEANGYLTPLATATP